VRLFFQVNAHLPTVQVLRLLLVQPSFPLTGRRLPGACMHWIHNIHVRTSTHSRIVLVKRVAIPKFGCLRSRAHLHRTDLACYFSFSSSSDIKRRRPLYHPHQATSHHTTPQQTTHNDSTFIMRWLSIRQTSPSSLHMDHSHSHDAASIYASCYLDMSSAHPLYAHGTILRVTTN
jgi:hypothetical protein